MENQNVIYGINGPVVTVKNARSFSMMEMVFVGHERLVGEIIGINDKFTTIQVYEETTGLTLGEPIYGTGSPMNVTLGPGIMSNIFDGIERPLKEIAKESGTFINRGSTASALDEEKLWDVTLKVQVGDTLKSGDVYAEVPETLSVLHKCMLTPLIPTATVTKVMPNGQYKVHDTVVEVEDANGKKHELTLCQRWPIRNARPVSKRTTSTVPLITGQRIQDALFPITKGGTACIPGAFGSGKTMTSFKSAQLIASSKDADKVIFLMDRIELGTQSLKEYRGFADENESVQATENTNVLITKLKSSNPADTLIVTSIQKMSNIKDEAGGLNARDIELISEKRIVFIVDEAHRSTFGDMLLTIKNTFPKAMFFGFTGTPIQDENQKKKNTTSTVFGNELHRYSIADGIRDKNVLGFDPYKVLTFKDKDVRKVVALEKAKAQTEEEAISDPVKSKIFYKYMDVNQVGMVGHFDAKGDYIKGIEDYIPNVQYTTTEHTTTVVKDILENWVTLSHNSKFHAIFATSSIPEAINYYRLFKELNPQLKVTALFDPSIDNNGGVQFKEDGLVEIISDYNEKYGQDFAIPTFAKMKKDIAARLAHKKPYERVATEPAKQIDLLIVVDQMLTGFDSKWINTLYMDKVLQYENIIQAFSRTNRLFGPDKPFGTIRYYRKPHTMEHNINAAVKLYSGDRPLGLFVQHLVENLKQMNELFESITELFTNAGIENFEKLPNDTLVCRKFAKDFNEFNSYLEAAKIQGFKWDVPAYVDEETGEVVDVAIDENTYLILVLRYKELTGGGGGIGGDDVPYDLAGYITEIDTGLIDSDYMNSRFDKYIKLLSVEGTTQEAIEQAETELHKTFATLSQEEQKYANIFLHDIQRGDVKVSEGKSLRDYINEYLSKARNDQIHRVSSALGLDENLLRNIMSLKLNENNLNEFGRYDELKKTVDKAKAKEYFEKVEGTKIIPPKVNVKVDKLLRDFIISGGYEIQMPTEDE